jgi:hypothetical protein
MRIAAVPLSTVLALGAVFGGAGPAGVAVGGQSQQQPVKKASVLPTATPRPAIPAGPSTVQAPPLPIRVRATETLTMTGVGDRPIASPTPAPPIRITATQALTMTGLGDRPLSTPTPAPPITVRAAQPLVMTGVH